MFLFPGMPGGLELLVVLLIMVILFGVPVAVVILGIVLLGRSRGDGDVEEEVAALREEVAELRASLGNDADAPATDETDETDESNDE